MEYFAHLAVGEYVITGDYFFLNVNNISFTSQAVHPSIHPFIHSSSSFIQQTSECLLLTSLIIKTYFFHGVCHLLKEIRCNNVMIICHKAWHSSCTLEAEPAWSTCLPFQLLANFLHSFSTVLSCRTQTHSEWACWCFFHVLLG